MDQIERALIVAEWRIMLNRQREDRDRLARNHEDEREMYYRRHKAAMDEAAAKGER